MQARRRRRRVNGPAVGRRKGRRTTRETTRSHRRAGHRTDRTPATDRSHYQQAAAVRLRRVLSLSGASGPEQAQGQVASGSPHAQVKRVNINVCVLEITALQDNGRLFDTQATYANVGVIVLASNIVASQHRVVYVLYTGISNGNVRKNTASRVLQFRSSISLQLSVLNARLRLLRCPSCYSELLTTQF